MIDYKADLLSNRDYFIFPGRTSTESDICLTEEKMFPSNTKHTFDQLTETLAYSSSEGLTSTTTPIVRYRYHEREVIEIYHTSA
ncbi:hypothetical protein RclHR1_06140015 [Rhizophagus clarus]|uniref:Uncharacterized protein n=1 Tax=Rhizophagus clarus TaxID=94130 RepID=A0A2Z6RWN8_9GLOM|nr:hypothetical protein RclHR1_06140015 [Rhizophagus clarus]